MTTNLADRDCVPARAGTPSLTADEIKPYLEQLAGWSVDDENKLTKSFEFKNFVQAVDLVNRITNQMPRRRTMILTSTLADREVRVYLWTRSRIAPRLWPATFPRDYASGPAISLLIDRRSPSRKRSTMMND